MDGISSLINVHVPMPESKRYTKVNPLFFILEEYNNNSSHKYELWLIGRTQDEDALLAYYDRAYKAWAEHYNMRIKPGRNYFMLLRFLEPDSSKTYLTREQAELMLLFY
jgi:hypothetical protein